MSDISVPIGGDMSASDPHRRLSFLRILALVVVVTAAISAPFAFRTVKTQLTAAADAAVEATSFAPYVDVTATPSYAFEDPTVSSSGNVVLGFVVSSTSVACQPSWGTAYSLATAATGMDLDRRIARLRQRGGDVTVSFGGAFNKELAAACTDDTKLAAAYRSVVDRYQLTSLDLDVEDAKESPEVAARRAKAIRAVQAADPALRVTLTLPVDPNGLTAAGTMELNAMLDAGVELTDVNALIMDYGDSGAGRSMAQRNEAALNSVAGQVQAAYTRIGTTLSTEGRWRYVAATPMIGQNDTPDDRFEPADAQSLLAFARAHHLRQLGMWSANRDKNCGVNYADTTVVSDSCSGVAQAKGAYAGILGKFSDVSPVPATSSSAPVVSATDDPKTSPYPIWNPLSSYPKNSKVVWHHNVYLAKWWTQGDTPDAPISNEADTPWTLVGPVLTGETPMATATVSPGTYQAWSPNHTYVAGDRVQYQGAAYQAKWWTVGDVPGATVSDPSDTPWEALTK